MSKTHSPSFNDSRDSGISTEKETEEIRSPRSPSKNSRPVRRHQLAKGSFKSLTTLGAKDSLDNVQKIRRRNDTRRTLNRGSAGSDKRGKKKLYSNSRKKFDKPHVSEANIRKVTEKFVDDDLNKKLVTIVQPRDIQNNYGIPKHHNIDGIPRNLSIDNEDEPTAEIAEYFEKLRITDDEVQKEEDPEEADIDYGSGDQQQQQQQDDFTLDCAGGYDAKRRSVQWNREVDVIYYAGDARGGKLVRRENEPLHEESEQQARRKRFIQLALTKSILPNVSASQLRDPWLVMPK